MISSSKKPSTQITLISVFILTTGCAGMYSLPPAPPESEWKAIEEEPESQEDIIRRFLDAKRAAIQCYAALADNNWTGALSWMSADTVAYLEEHSNGEGAESVLENGTLYLNDEKTTFDPVGDVFIRGLNDIRDDFGGRSDNESATRKVLYAVSASGQAREIVFIYENEKWRLDKTDFQSELLTE